MELVEAGSLYDAIHTNRHPALREVSVRLRVALEVASALAYLHHRGVVHKDVKSFNVLLTQDFHAKLCDFGLARLKSTLNTGRLQHAGTPAYMAPELFRQGHYTEKVDVFAFAVLLWELLTLEVPFDGLDALLIRPKVESGAPLHVPSAGCPPDIRQLLHECWSVDGDQRPPMAHVVETLKRCVQQ